MIKLKGAQNPSEKNLIEVAADLLGHEGSARVKSLVISSCAGQPVELTITLLLSADEYDQAMKGDWRDLTTDQQRQAVGIVGIDPEEFKS